MRWFHWVGLSLASALALVLWADHRATSRERSASSPRRSEDSLAWAAADTEAKQLYTDVLQRMQLDAEKRETLSSRLRAESATRVKVADSLAKQNAVLEISLAAAQSDAEKLAIYPALVTGLQLERDTLRSVLASLSTAFQRQAESAANWQRLHQVDSTEIARLRARPPLVVGDTVRVSAQGRKILGILPVPRLHIGLRLLSRCAGPVCAVATVGW